MIDSIHIEGFRCYERLDVSDLRRINIIVGRNASGKTALLEALLLSSSSIAPHVALFLKRMRHQPAVPFRNGQEGSPPEAPWEDLFFRLDTKTPVLLQVQGSPSHTWSLRVSYGDPSSPTLPFGQQAEDPVFVPPVEFKWSWGSRETVVRPKMTPGGIVLEGAVATESAPVFITGPQIPESPESSAKYFSKLSKENRHGLVVEALRSEFPLLEGLDIQLTAGVPTVHAAVTGIPQKIPVGLVSEGVDRLLTLVLGIITCEGGLALVDQIEDGFYYDRLESIWRILFGLCKRFNVQLFVTTHSQENLRALASAAVGSEDEVCGLRTTRIASGATVERLSGRQITTAIAGGFEVR